MGEEPKDLMHIILKEVGVDVEVKRILWVKHQPDYEPLFSIMGKLRKDNDRHFWIENFESQGDNCDIEADTGQMGTGVEIRLQMSHNVLTISGEYVK
jgi:hypothetical protein